jgi:hypothetical protein
VIEERRLVQYITWFVPQVSLPYLPEANVVFLLDIARTVDIDFSPCIFEFANFFSIDQREIGSNLVYIGKVVGYHGNQDACENVHGYNIER